MHSIFDSTDLINNILLAHAAEVEDMAEPLDYDCGIHPMEAADVMGIADDIFEESHPELAWRDSSDPYPEDDFIIMG